MDLKITGIETKDIRFPTSRLLDGSDAMNPDPDYSAAYVILKTNQDGMEGHGLTFTIGRGNEICVAAIEAMSLHIINQPFHSIKSDFGSFAKVNRGQSTTVAGA